eukprot:CAMPEP_0172865986 /NCGR_PEP_ID=MMETSP1075-20121228/81722_1 /TAXON_ID=2916 /ORGANISM="Ceratium fusus, Strain PA161109" /LENGTH=599 /DNA_ID=CAMNT_0013715093 /DNA_START=75 /DNA_END=1871 /DNA_ORIENTATION=+
MVRIQRSLCRGYALMTGPHRSGFSREMTSENGEFVQPGDSGAEASAAWRKRAAVAFSVILGLLVCALGLQSLRHHLHQGLRAPAPKRHALVEERESSGRSDSEPKVHFFSSPGESTQGTFAGTVTERRGIVSVNVEPAVTSDRSRRRSSGSSSSSSIAEETLAVVKAEVFHGASEWEVVHDGPMNVRKGKDLGSEVVSVKLPGTFVPGQRDGDWIALFNEPGFMRIAFQGRTFLRPRSVTYSMLSRGACADLRMFPIFDTGTCQKAGFSLGYFDTGIGIYSGENARPEGCYIFQGQLWLATNPVHAGRGAMGPRTQICSTGFYPTTTTTTTSTVTTITHTTTTTVTSTTATTITKTTTTTSTTSTTWGFPSLFCVEVVRTHGYELPMVKAQQRVHASIFSCEEYRVFSDGGQEQVIGIGPGGEEIRTIVIPPIKKQMGDLKDKGVTTNSWLNTETFLQVWNLLDKRDGRWIHHDWVIKVDPDAVFFPDRLRKKLRGHTSDGSNLFVMNCDKYKPVALYGSLEIFSKKALHNYLHGQWDCRRNLPWKGWGEDFFMSHCMQHLNVKPLYDFSLIGDKRCHYAPCSDTSKIVYHDYKNLNDW